MTPTQVRRYSCLFALAVCTILMVWVMDWVTDIPAEVTTNAHSLLVGAVFAPVAAIFKFALDAIDGKIDDKAGT